jgi:cell division septum initiation protein DivIVA
MSDYGNLMEENIRLKAEIEDLKAQIESLNRQPTLDHLGGNASKKAIESKAEGAK